MSAKHPQHGAIVSMYIHQIANMPVDMQQAVVNIVRYLQAKYPTKKWGHVFEPITSAEWTPYENAVLFPRNVLPGMMNVLSQMMSGTWIANQGELNDSRFQLDMLIEAIGEAKVKASHIDTAMLDKIVENEQAVRDLVQLAKVLTENGRKIGDLSMIDLTAAYRLARFSLLGEDNFSVPGLLDTEAQRAMHTHPAVQRLADAAKHFYEAMLLWGEINTDVLTEVRYEEMEAVMLEIFRKVESGLPKKIEAAIPGQLNELSGFLNVPTGTIVIESGPVSPENDAPANAYLEPPVLGEFNLATYLKELSPAARYQLFKLALFTNSLTLKEWRDISDRCNHLKVPVLDYIYHNSDNTLMRNALRTIVEANRHRGMLNPHDMQHNTYLWLKELVEHIGGYYPLSAFNSEAEEDTRVAIDDLPAVTSKEDQEDNQVKGTGPVTPDRFFRVMEEMTQAEVDATLNHLFNVLRDEGYVKEHMNYDLNRGIVSITIPTTPISRNALQPVLQAMETHGWDVGVPINTDFDGDEPRPSFALRLEAKRAS